ncbi:hypothetical protein J8273_1053 [Carpediemonas membranifera]|uniref:MRG domain-containing protein n=1 Tax=Carpediemonas membranifera TaxID=201153 RepID=A0A8J6B9S6_9EUKA|nr:hypothetical protein J8273_1053 [Carpediemonas membranifera]|eukprot:KAG9397144.1 hypothetical protein J8273_1053 [Carpediemonas membranifera]
MSRSSRRIDMSCPFSIGDLVACPMNAMKGQLVEGRVSLINAEEGTALIHYKGWNSRNDAWIPFNQIQKQSASTTSNKTTLLDQPNLPEEIRSLLELPTPLAATAVTELVSVEPDLLELIPTAPRTMDEIMTDYGATVTDSPLEPLSLQFTPELQARMATDHHNIVELGKLLNLPRSTDYYSVDKIVVDFLLENLNFDDAELASGRRSLYLLFTKGLLRCFNTYFSEFLLYKEEWDQFESLQSRPQRLESCATLFKGPPDIKAPFVPSRVYGVEHFLRFFVKAPLLVASQSVTAEQLSTLLSMMQDIIQFIDKHEKKLFAASRYVGSDEVVFDDDEEAAELMEERKLAQES